VSCRRVSCNHDASIPRRGLPRAFTLIAGALALSLLGGVVLAAPAWAQLGAPTTGLAVTGTGEATAPAQTATV
jgi:hypothetical protein